MSESPAAAAPNAAVLRAFGVETNDLSSFASKILTDPNADTVAKLARGLLYLTRTQVRFRLDALVYVRVCCMCMQLSRMHA